MNKINETVVKLNIGGSVYQTSLQTITKVYINNLTCFQDKYDPIQYKKCG